MTDKQYYTIVRGLSSHITRDCKIPVSQLVHWLYYLDKATDLMSDYDDAYDRVVDVEVEIMDKIKRLKANIDYGESLKRKL